MDKILQKVTQKIILILVLIVVPFSSMAAKYHNFKSYTEFGINELDVKQAVEQSKINHPSDLKEQARELTQFYRNSGMSFHLVMAVPDGLRLYEGVLTSVFVHDPKWKTVIGTQLEDLVGSIIYAPQLQEKLLAINSWPGLEVFSFFSVADDVGGVNLNVMIKNKKMGLANVSIDNLGQTSTGKHQYSVSLKGYNLLLKPSALSINIRGTEKIGNEGLSIQYDKVLDSKTNFYNSLTYQKITFDYDLGDAFDDFIVEGQKYAFRSQLTKQNNTSAFVSNKMNAWLNVTQNFMSGSTELIDNFTFNGLDQDNLFVNLGGEISSNRLFKNQLSSWRQSYSFSVGLLQDNLAPAEDSIPVSTKIMTTQQFRQSLIGGLYQKMDLQLNIKAQWLNDQGHSSEKMSLTGPTAMAQWESSLVSVHNSLLADLKLNVWQFNAKGFDASLFANYQIAYGENPDDSNYTFQGASVITSAGYKGFVLNTQFHQPITAPDGFELTQSMNFTLGYHYEF